MIQLDKQLLIIVMCISYIMYNVIHYNVVPLCVRTQYLYTFIF